LINVASFNYPNTTTKQHFPITWQANSSKLLNSISYLGIIIDHRLSWKPQINHVCNKATRILTTQNCSRPLKDLSYRQFILPVLEYAAAIWDSYHLTDINKIEMIQHRAARFVLNRPWRRNMQDSITEMLTSLEWPPLKLCRKCGRLTLLYKIIHNLIEIPSSYLPTLSPVTITRSNHDQKFLHYHTSIDIHFSQEQLSVRESCAWVCVVMLPL